VDRRARQALDDEGLIERKTDELGERVKVHGERYVYRITDKGLRDCEIYKGLKSL